MNFLYKNLNEIVIVIFSSKTCVPCKELFKKLMDKTEPLNKDLNDVKYIILDGEDKNNSDLIKSFKVTHVPHILFLSMKNENNVKKLIIKDEMVGYDYKVLINIYKKLINK